MTENWTAGPWVARCVNAEAKPFAVINPNGPFGDDIIVGWLNEANAHLIAAAPELYEELELLLDTFQGYQGMKFTKANAALAKARGETK